MESGDQKITQDEAVVDLVNKVDDISSLHTGHLGAVRTRDELLNIPLLDLVKVPSSLRGPFWEAVRWAILFVLLPLILLGMLGYLVKSKKILRLKLEHIALLVMSIEQADERLGDLDEQRVIITARHGTSYARLWYCWTGFWLVVAAIFRKIPIDRLLALLKMQRG